MNEKFPSPAEPDPREARRLQLLAMKSGAPRGQFRPVTEQSMVRERNTQEKAEDFRNKYIEKNPQDGGGADIAAGLAWSIENDRRFHGKELRTKEERFAVTMKQAAFNTRWTEYVHKNSENENLLRNHWRALESMLKGEEDQTSYRLTRAGIITQVATMKIFEALGISCTSSNEIEDGMVGIDFWLESENDPGHRELLQVKSRKDIEHVEVVETDTTGPLVVRVNGGDKKAIVTSADMENILRLRRKLDTYAHDQNLASVRGFYITIPNHPAYVDRVTGKPTQLLIKEVTAELRNLKYLPEQPAAPVEALAA